MWFIDTAGASPSQAEPLPFVTGTDLPIDGGTIAAMKSGAYSGVMGRDHVTPLIRAAYKVINKLELI